jgi:hypothetical protein
LASGESIFPRTPGPAIFVLQAGDNLLDATISQASRPASCVRLPDMLVVPNVPDTFCHRDKAILHQTRDGSMVRYEPHPKNNGYIASPRWRLRPGIEEAANQEIMELLEGANVGLKLHPGLELLGGFVGQSCGWRMSRAGCAV